MNIPIPKLKYLPQNQQTYEQFRVARKIKGRSTHEFVYSPFYHVLRAKRGENKIFKNSYVWKLHCVVYRSLVNKRFFFKE